MGKKIHGLKYKSSRSQIVNKPYDYFIFCCYWLSFFDLDKSSLTFNFQASAFFLGYC